MPTASQVRQASRALSTTSALAKRDLEAFWLTLDTSNMVFAREQLEAFFPALIDTYGNVASTVMADWYEELFNEASALAEMTAAERANARMRWAIGKAFEGDPAQALATLKVVTDELVKQAGRDTVILSSKRNGRRYARVPTGKETCAFCLMTASRGFVYESEGTAGKMAKYHGDCDCTITPEDGTVPDGYDPDALYEQYSAVHESGDSDKQVAAKMREQFDLS